jgi:hypothetical protein
MGLIAVFSVHLESFINVWHVPQNVGYIKKKQHCWSMRTKTTYWRPPRARSIKTHQDFSENYYDPQSVVHLNPLEVPESFLEISQKNFKTVEFCVSIVVLFNNVSTDLVTEQCMRWEDEMVTIWKEVVVINNMVLSWYSHRETEEKHYNLSG